MTFLSKIKKYLDSFSGLGGLIAALAGVFGLTAAHYTNTPLVSTYGLTQAGMVGAGGIALAYRERKRSKQLATGVTVVAADAVPPSVIDLKMGDRSIYVSLSSTCSSEDVKKVVSSLVSAVVDSKEGVKNEPKLVLPVVTPVAPPAPASLVIPAVPVAPAV